MTAKTMCMLHGCRTPIPYHAAYPLNSTQDVSKDYQYMGIGTIHSYNGNLYSIRKEFKFYITKR